MVLADVWFCCVVLSCGICPKNHRNILWYFPMVFPVVPLCGFAVWYSCVVLSCGSPVVYVQKKTQEYPVVFSYGIFYGISCGTAVWFCCVVLLCGFAVWYSCVVLSCGSPVVYVQKNHRNILWYFPMVFSMVFPVVPLCGITTGVPQDIFVRDVPKTNQQNTFKERKSDLNMSNSSLMLY